MISIIPVQGVPIIRDEEELWDVLLDKLQQIIQQGDILVCAHTPFSRVLGYLHEISEITPSEEAIKMAQELGKDPRKIQIVLDASKKVVKHGRGVVITENKAGIICANGGVDESNAGIGMAVSVPDNPDVLAKKVRERIKDVLGVDIAVIISDTVGRALRKHAVNIAIGVAGIPASRSSIGRKDLFGYDMQVSIVGVADELASAAELCMGQSDEGTPFVIIRGYSLDFEGDLKAADINRPEEERLFR